MRKAYEKRETDKWRRALRHLKINDLLFPKHKDELSEMDPFKNFNVYKICEGNFQHCPIPLIILEIVTFEIINQCYHTKLKDISGNEIYGTFHSDCRDMIKKDRCRKGSVVILRDVSSFRMSNGRYYLVIISKCIDRIC